MMSIQYEDRLDGISNYLPWKVRITAFVKDWNIWSFANTVMTKPTDNDALEEFEALEVRAQRVISDGVKDHMTPQLAEKTIANDMWKTIKHLFEVNNEN